MRIVGARVVRYDLPLIQPWTTAQGEARTRSGHLLWLRSDAGGVAVGDAAPLPDRRAAGLAQDQQQLSRIVRSVQRGALEADLTPPLEPPFERTVRHAWTQAVLTLEALERRVSLARRLAQVAGDRGPALAARVPVNATVPLLPTKPTVAHAEAAVRTGYKCLKVKVGAHPHEIERVAAVRAAIGSRVRLRVDANASWDEDSAPRFLEKLEPLNIEYVEQPLPPGRPTELAALRRHSPIPLAADESAHSFQHAVGILERRAVDVIVLKPMALGGLDRAIQLLVLARKGRVRCVVTDALDSAVGRAGALHAAALLGARASHCGLGTGEWLARDVTEDPPRVRRGFLAVPRGPGLGVKVVPPEGNGW